MVRSLTKRGMPKPFAILIAALLALYFVPLGASPAAAAGPANINVYDQCFTGDPPVGGGACEGWTNGILNDSNSDYAEDEVTPQRLVVTFQEAGTHTIDISYLTFDHNVHAYDSLATWNYTLTSADRDLVGQTAARLRALRPPDSYKGKGVRFAGEVVRKKVGKTGAK